MARLLKEMKDDASFIRSHTLQPQWYKVLKIFIVIGVVAAYYALFGLAKTALFFAVFVLLSLLVHLTYRAKTHKFTRTWLDFIVVEEDGKPKPKSIGAFYYTAVVLNAAIAVIVSQIAPLT